MKLNNRKLGFFILQIQFLIHFNLGNISKNNKQNMRTWKNINYQSPQK